MSVRVLLMLSAVVLTLVFPAILAARFASHSKPRCHLTVLAVGLLLQIVGECALVWVGQRDWLPYYEGPFVVFRFVQLFLLLRMARHLQKVERFLVLATLLLNIALWRTIAYRLLGRL